MTQRNQPRPTDTEILAVLEREIMRARLRKDQETLRVLKALAGDVQEHRIVKVVDDTSISSSVA